MDAVPKVALAPGPAMATPSAIAATVVLCLTVIVILLTVICFVYWKKPRLLSPILRPPASFYVLATFRNQGRVLKEWLQHYAGQGAEHIILVDTGSTDAFQDSIQDFVTSGLASVYKDARGHQAKREVLNYYFTQYVVGKTDWVLVCDLDEFVFGTKRVPLALELLEVPEDVGALYFRWVVFGSSGHESQPPSVLKALTMRVKYPDATPALARSRYIARVDSVGPNGLDVFGVALKDSAPRRTVRFGDNRTEASLQTEPIRVHRYPVQSLEAVRKTHAQNPAGAAAYLKVHDRNDKEDKSLA